MRLTIAYGCTSRIADIAWHGKIRLADLEVDYVFALTFKFLQCGENLEHGPAQQVDGTLAIIS
jgi:hypothetical protein